jgi:hypothetical protein
MAVLVFRQIILSWFYGLSVEKFAVTRMYLNMLFSKLENANAMERAVLCCELVDDPETTLAE